MARQTTRVSNRPVEAVEALGDSYSLDIMSALSRDTMSVKQLSESLDVPIATAYRRIEELENVGLVEEEGKMVQDGGRNVTVYGTSVEEVQVSFDGGTPRVEIRAMSDARKRIDTAWDQIKTGVDG